MFASTLCHVARSVAKTSRSNAVVPLIADRDANGLVRAADAAPLLGRFPGIWHEP